ncbi:MAG: TonB-dependent siderophore receptor [Sphingomonas sp.]|nr:MAG: TonB-dependent siderophore receptor [Sphingomonas sp.]
MAVAAPAEAQVAVPEGVDREAQVADDNAAQGDITVTGWRLRQLDTDVPTGSRLGLSIRETPATVDQISSEEILTRGFRTVEEATVSMPGLISGGTPGNPSLFSMRGFTGEQITILHNGLYLGPANMVNRPGNTFNIETIDILKGPASVLYGQGAVGGAVNIVNKTADPEKDSLQALASYATFNTVSLGLGGNKVLSDSTALRLDASYHRTDGYVDNADSNSFNVTGALLLRPRDDLSIELSADLLIDNLSNYFGTPLVPASFAKDPIGGLLTTASGYVVDDATRKVNYNVSDSKLHSWQVWPRAVVNWSATDNLTISDTAYYFHAERQWINAETYTFDTATSQITRDRFFVFHNQDLFGNQLSATLAGSLFGLKNKLVVGIDYSHLDMIRSRGFPDGDSVDPYNPVAGTFGPIEERLSPTRWDQVALFGEDVLSLTDRLKLVTGVRAERLMLTRENYAVDGTLLADTGFRRTYKPFNWRAGLVYDIAPSVTTYASFSTGKDPVGSNILVVNASENFGLSSSQQIEAGVKADLMGNRGSITLSLYDIKRRNILTLIDLDTVSNVGAQKSRGVELSGQFKVMPAWTVIASATYVDAKYENFVDPTYGIAASGNRPANVPAWTGSFWTTVRNVAGLPVELGGGVKYVDKRAGNTANTLLLKPYATGIVYGTYEINPRLSLTARVNNVWDKRYVQWADIYYPNQVTLGEPRRIEISALARF